MTSLKGKTLFITGGSRGIGLAIAKRAARDGAHIAIAAKTTAPQPKLEGTIFTAAKEIEDAGGRALPIACDIRDEAQVIAAVDQAVAYLNGLGGAYAAWLGQFDVILSPVLSLPPVELGWLAPDLPVETMAERLPAYVGYTTPANVVGAPAMSVPGAWSAAGLPIGAQFQAAVGDEAALLALAYEIEAARPWAGRRPGVCA